MLDKKALESHAILVKQKAQQQLGRDKKRKLDREFENDGEEAGPFRVNKEGKLLITDLDGHKKAKKKKSSQEMESETPKDNDCDEEQEGEEEEEY